jgi:hypothetical protein
MAAKTIKKRIKMDTESNLIPIRTSFEKDLKNDADEECDLWNISMSELIRNILRAYLKLSIEERRNIILPLPGRKR